MGDRNTTFTDLANYVDHGKNTSIFGCLTLESRKEIAGQKSQDLKGIA